MNSSSYLFGNLQYEVDGKKFLSNKTIIFFLLNDSFPENLLCTYLFPLFPEISSIDVINIVFSIDI